VLYFLPLSLSPSSSCFTIRRFHVYHTYLIANHGYILEDIY
jgi:hypothetical protein